ncbi:MAG TPA: class I SAM-dependent methyltransferase [Acidobacteriota bacterium]|nr:class I SAM-dependent methyltransferase [Acidobacteriota bacterium]
MQLKRCYEIAPPRVRQYLEAEVQHVLGYLREDHLVLETGCGYGRILPALASRAATVVGIDTSLSSLLLGREMLADLPDCHLACMDAARMAFRDDVFDCVVCIQNGISAFHVDRETLIRECVRVTRPGGMVLFSSYADSFWADRLAWFELQAEAGLLGEIDRERTGDGQIVCKDGFTATTVRPARFRSLAGQLGLRAQIVEVDGSSLFFEIMVG